jgi:hypothetical protein
VLRIVAVVAVAATLCLSPAAAQEQDPAGNTTTLVEGQDLPGVIPRPNQGRAPQQPGDPGGWLQLTLAALVVVGVGAIFAVVARSAIRTTRSKRVE